MPRFINPVVVGDTNAILADPTTLAGMTQTVYYCKIAAVATEWYLYVYSNADRTLEYLVGQSEKLAAGLVLMDTTGNKTIIGSITIANYASIAEDSDITITWTDTETGPAFSGPLLLNGEEDGSIGGLLNG